MVRQPHHVRPRDLVRRADVAAAGFAVSPPGCTTLRVVITRRCNGDWTVVDDSELQGLPGPSRERAISTSAAVICGANLFGILVTELAIDDEVRWVRVSRPGAPGHDPSTRRV